jgi:NitT/TauT family transport system substrate-binding protein
VNRRTVLKGLLAGSALVVTPGLLAACGSSPSSPNSSALSSPGLSSPARSELAPSPAAGTAALAALTYQFSWLKLEQFNGLFVAQENGYFADNQINATLNAGGPNVIASQIVAGGRADLGDEDHITLLQAQAKGIPLVAFATVFQKSPYACISFAGNPINTLADFSGKTIAIDTAGQAQLEPVLAAAGITGVTIIPAGPDPTQLTTKQADGYFGYSTNQGVSLQRQGLDVVFAFAADLGFGGYNNVLVATKDTLATKHDELVRFLRSVIKGYEFAAQNPDVAAQLTVDKYGPAGADLETEKAVAREQVELIATAKGPMWIEPARMQEIIDAQVISGAITTSLKAEDVMTTSVLEAAYGGKTTLLGS